VFSDPINFIDPNGKFAWNVISGAFGALLGGLDAAGQANATFGSIMSGIAIGGATGFIGLNPATNSLIKMALVAAINYGGNIASQLNQNVNNLDHSQALVASMLGLTGGVDKALKFIKQYGEIGKHTAELTKQWLHNLILKWESENGKRCP